MLFSLQTSRNFAHVTFVRTMDNKFSTTFSDGGLRGALSRVTIWGLHSFLDSMLGDAFGFASQDILAACEVSEKAVEAINDTKDWDQGSMPAVLQRFRLCHTKSSTAKELWMQLKRDIAAGLRGPRKVPLKLPPDTLIYKSCLSGAKAIERPRANIEKEKDDEDEDEDEDEDRRRKRRSRRRRPSHRISRRGVLPNGGVLHHLPECRSRHVLEQTKSIPGRVSWTVLGGEKTRHHSAL